MTIDVHVSRLPFTASEIMSHAPKAPGVYVVYHDTELLYVGEGEDIREGLCDLAEGAIPPLLQASPSGFAFEVVMHGEMRVARQHALILQLHPRFHEALC
jgi:hypothetical protein